MKTNIPTAHRLARWGRGGIAGLLLVAGAVSLSAQNRLYVKAGDGNYHMVCKVTGGRPYYTDGDRVVAANGDQFALKKVEEYLPILITVADEKLTASSLHLAATDEYHNNQFHYQAKFESTDPLDDVFLALEMEISNVGKRIFVYEIGHLEARDAKPLEVTLSMGQYLGAGEFTVHLFVAGAEVLHTDMTEAFRQEQLDRMVAARTAALKPAAPTPFFGSMPAYPAELRDTGRKGTAVVTMRITVDGKVVDPVVDSASEPAFGAAALAAARDWRFLPRVVDGKPVESRVSLPLAFDPPPAGR